MATDAGQGISGVPGAAEAEPNSKGNGKATKKPKLTFHDPPPPGFYKTTYDEDDSFSPPSIPNEFYRTGLNPSDPRPDSADSAEHVIEFNDYYSDRVKALLDVATRRLTKFQLENELKTKPPRVIVKMAAPQLIFVDGSFAELAQEMADYVQVGDQVKPLLEQEKNEDALQAIVKASHFLNSVPEKDFTGAYNLLVHLVLQSKDPKKYLPTVCGNLLKPITSSPTHGYTLAANALSTVFNLLPQDNPLRYNVMIQIARFMRQHGQFDVLKPQLKNLENWFATWDTDEEDQRRLYVEVSDAAAEAGDDEESYHHLLKALATFDSDDQEEITSEEAQKLSLKALRMAILAPARFDFQSLRALPSVQALSDSHPVYSQLLEIFSEQDLEDYNDFKDEHEGWIEKEKLDNDKLMRKMRLLTFASLAATTPNREIPYANIARALQIPSEEVELWAIDVVRAQLVEGRLSQQKQVFLVHRTTYRVFGEKQWRELATRIDQMKSVVDRLTVVVRKAQADVDQQRERDQQEIERKLASANFGSGERRRGPMKPRTDDDD